MPGLELLLTLLPLSEESFTLLLLFLAFDFVVSLPFVAFEYFDLLLLHPVDVAQELLLDFKLNHLGVEVFFEVVLLGYEETDARVLVVELLLYARNLAGKGGFVIHEDFLTVTD